MSIQEFPITPEGYEILKEEVDHLKKVERPRISEEIGAAIELGDLKENFEYHSAKDRQGMIEAKIRDLEGKFSRAKIIDPKKLSGERVVFGATVTIEDVESGDEKTYQIVGETELDIENNKISIISPLARALIGKELGDETKVPGKGGPKVVEITEVEFI